MNYARNKELPSGAQETGIIYPALKFKI